MFFLELAKLSHSKMITGNNQTIAVLRQSKSGTLPSFCFDNAHSDAHVPLTQTMNESDRKEAIEEEISNENGEHVEVKDEVNFLLLSGDKDFPGETIFR